MEHYRKALMQLAAEAHAKSDLLQAMYIHALVEEADRAYAEDVRVAKRNRLRRRHGIKEGQ